MYFDRLIIKNIILLSFFFLLGALQAQDPNPGIFGTHEDPVAVDTVAVADSVSTSRIVRWEDYIDKRGTLWLCGNWEVINDTNAVLVTPRIKYLVDRYRIGDSLAYTWSAWDTLATDSIRTTQQDWNYSISSLSSWQGCMGFLIEFLMSNAGRNIAIRGTEGLK